MSAPSTQPAYQEWTTSHPDDIAPETVLEPALLPSPRDKLCCVFIMNGCLVMYAVGSNYVYLQPTDWEASHSILVATIASGVLLALLCLIVYAWHTIFSSPKPTDLGPVLRVRLRQIAWDVRGRRWSRAATGVIRTVSEMKFVVAGAWAWGVLGFVLWMQKLKMEKEAS